MDNSGNNRYELLFMDDDISGPSLDNVSKKKVKQQHHHHSGGAPAAPMGSSKQNAGQQPHKKLAQMDVGGSCSNTTAEKENKSSAMNKNFESTKGRITSLPANQKSKPSVTGGVSGNSGGQLSNSGGTGGMANQTHQTGFVRRGGGGTDREQRETGATRNVNFKQQNGESREQRNNRRNRENAPPGATGGAGGNVGGGGENTDRKNIQRQLRERDSARGPPRHQHNSNEFGTGSGRGGKREFDRQSGSDKTGVKAVDKRDGAGAHNWGSVKQDIEDVNNKSAEETGLTDKEESNDLSTEPVTADEETKELTLDEWKAQRQQRVKPQYNIRKAGEGEDVTQWKKMIALTNKKKDDDSEEELEYDPSLYPQRVGRLQRVLDIQFHFNDGRRGGGGGMGRGRGGRGGRGGGASGGGDRGADRGDRVGQGGLGGTNFGAAVGGFERGRFDGSRGVVETGSRPNMGRPRNTESQRQQREGDNKRGGQSALKVDDERQFPTLS